MDKLALTLWRRMCLRSVGYVSVIETIFYDFGCFFLARQLLHAQINSTCFFDVVVAGGWQSLSLCTTLRHGTRRTTFIITRVVCVWFYLRVDGSFVCAIISVDRQNAPPWLLVVTHFYENGSIKSVSIEPSEIILNGWIRRCRKFSFCVLFALVLVSEIM